MFYHSIKNLVQLHLKDKYSNIACNRSLFLEHYVEFTNQENITEVFGKC